MSVDVDSTASDFTWKLAVKKSDMANAVTALGKPDPIDDIILVFHYSVA